MSTDKSMYVCTMTTSSPDFRVNLLDIYLPISLTCLQKAGKYYVHHHMCGKTHRAINYPMYPRNSMKIARIYPYRYIPFITYQVIYHTVCITIHTLVATMFSVDIYLVFMIVIIFLTINIHHTFETLEQEHNGLFIDDYR